MDEQNQEMIINYETVYDLLRREKSREEVQQLPENFVQELSKHIEGLLNQINKKRREIDSFSSEEINKEEQKYQNLQKVVSELYEKRERKIINMAITKSRTDAKLADVSNLLDTEKELYNSLVEVLNYYRERSMNEMLAKKKQVKKPQMLESQEQEEENQATEESQEKTDGKREVDNSQEKQNKMVRFLYAVPKFFDKDMNILGPFEPDEMANLPGEIADILIKKGRAEEINNNGG